MDHRSIGYVTAIAFCWFGMVLAISFIEAPLKFRAPGVTVAIGLGIGRLVFRALNLAELALGICLLITIIAGLVNATLSTLAIVALGLLAIQLAAIRPLLSRRSDRILHGSEDEVPRSRAHIAYIVTEVLKAVSLLALGICTF